MCAAAAACSAAATTDPLAILAAAKRASGGRHWDTLESLHQTGIARQGAQDGTFDTLVDLKHVRGISREIIGPTLMAQAWDGAAGWAVEGAGQAMPGTGHEAIAAGIGMAYKAAYAFFWPQRFPAKFAYGGRKPVDGKVVDVVLVTPDGAGPFELWIDRRTHLIAREVEIGGIAPTTLTFADYRAVDGVLLPFAVRESTGDAELDSVYALETSTAGNALQQATFAPPAPIPEPDPFPAGQDSTVVPIHIVENHIYLPAKINGGAPQTFIFDTGAIAILDQTHAQAMGIRPEGAMQGAGFGNDMVHFSKSRVQSIAIGDVTFPAQSVLTLDMTGFMHLADVDFAGLLGVEIAQRAVVRIDYARETLTLTKPSAFKPPPTAIAVALKFNGHHPVVDGVIDGMTGEFEIDTGADNALTLMAPFSKAHQLTSKYPAAREVLFTGVGGQSKEYMVRTGMLQIGDATIAHLVTNIATDPKGVAASPWTAGNIGADVLRRFIVTLDYPHRLMYLEPTTYDTAIADYDRSGLDLERAGDGSAAITNVFSGSSAEQAGLRVGEHIVKIDGKDVATTALPALRTTLRGPVGLEVILSVLGSDGHRREVRLRLRDLI